MPSIDHEAVADLGEPLCWVFFDLVVVVGPATLDGWPGPVEMTPKHNALLEGVLDGPLMVGARLLEHLVEEVCTSGGLPRVLVLGGGDKVRVGGVAFRLRLLLALLLGAARSRRLGSLFRWAALGLLVLSEDSLNRLLARGELGGDVHQLARPGGGLATQLAHQVAASGAGEERADDIRVGDVGQIGALLRESPDVVPERLPRLLPAASKVPGVPGAHVCALEIASEGLDQVVPVGNLPWRQVLQPGASGVGEEQGEVTDDEVVIVRSTQLAGQPVVCEPQFRSRLPRVLCDSSRGSEPGRERRPSDGSAEGLRTGWFGRGTPILPAVVASPTPGVVASAHPLIEVGSTVAVVVLVAEATRGRRRRVARAPGVDRGFPHESGSRGAMLRGVPLPSGGRDFGPSDRDILQEILELSLDAPPFGGRWFRHHAE